MTLKRRIEIIKRIERIRESKVISYTTGMRANVPMQMSQDVVRVFFEHVVGITKKIPKLDIFLASNGGDSLVPWRLNALFREYAEKVNVLVPYRAYSAATLLSLGADEIVMHPFGELGPIDPTVTNEYNPKENGRTIGISVEDVKAYISFIKETVGITHEDELILALNPLLDKVHPLALGNVERFISQSRMVARKLLRIHMGDSDEHQIEEIIENLASKLFFHGHPINRIEARDELKLKVNTDLPKRLQSSMWQLYKEYESEFKNTKPFDPVADLALAAWPLNSPAGHTASLPIEKVYEHVGAMVESSQLSSKFTKKERYVMLGAANFQPQLRQDTIFQGWENTKI